MLPDKLVQLRQKHPSIRYRDFTVTDKNDRIEIEYSFFLEPNISFKPRITIPTTKLAIDAISNKLIFLIGMAELISYWKAACPKEIIIECGEIEPTELAWWQELYRKGLGEFFFTNQIPPDLDFSFIAKNSHKNTFKQDSLIQESNDSTLILVGGGKDSLVSLELLRALAHKDTTQYSTFCINPIPASVSAIRHAEILNPLIAHRVIDPQLIELNKNGYLNGHTPFSALLAFVSTLAAYQNNYSRVIASNETSASEGNAFFHGVEVNHQYSKSYHFEKVFREYLTQLNIPVNYFSLLRPLNELQICAFFSQFTEYHSIFRSCNREQTMEARVQSARNVNDLRTPGWCGECPKCVFTFICLSCFLPEAVTDAIFGISPLKHSSFTAVARDLCGFGEHKPLECVGTYREVQSALRALYDNQPERIPKSLRSAMKDLYSLINPAIPGLNTLLNEWDKNHFIPEDLADYLNKKLKNSVAH